MVVQLYLVCTGHIWVSGEDIKISRAAHSGQAIGCISALTTQRNIGRSKSSFALLIPFGPSVVMLGWPQKKILKDMERIRAVLFI